MSLTHFVFAGSVGLCLSATAAFAEWNGFCGTYQQITSNAGDCPTCKLTIADNPKIQFYGVEANNGWQAELFWVEGDESVAAGGGQWSDNAGAYAQERFAVDMTRQGNRLFMEMRHYNPALGGVVTAEYVCLD